MLVLYSVRLYESQAFITLFTSGSGLFWICNVICTPHTQTGSDTLIRTIFGLRGTNRSNRKEYSLHRIMHRKGKRNKEITKASLKDHAMLQNITYRQALEMYK